MRRVINDINTSQEEMSKKDIIETILYIIDQILAYTSKLDQVIPSIFDKKEKEEKNKEEDLSTCQSLSDINSEDKEDKEDSTEEEKKYSLADYFYYWTDKLNFDGNMLILMMMNLDKILNSKKIILTEKNVKNVLFTCMVITQKYHEDDIYSDKDYSNLLKINCDEFIEMQIKYLECIDYSLLIEKDDLEQYKIKMKKIWRNSMLFLLNG